MVTKKTKRRDSDEAENTTSKMMKEAPVTGSSASDDDDEDDDGSVATSSNNIDSSGGGDYNDGERRGGGQVHQHSKVQARREANRLHAFKSRQRTKNLLTELQQTVTKISQEKADLERKNAALTAQVDILQQQYLTLLQNLQQQQQVQQQVQQAVVGNTSNMLPGLTGGIPLQQQLLSLQQQQQQPQQPSQQGGMQQQQQQQQQQIQAANAAAMQVVLASMMGAAAVNGGISPSNSNGPNLGMFNTNSFLGQPSSFGSTNPSTLGTSALHGRHLSTPSSGIGEI